MDTIRVLRHDVRNCMLSYMSEHKDNQPAFLATMSVLFLLAGRGGLQVEDRVDLVTSAHTAVRMLMMEVEFDPILDRAHEGIHQIMALMADDVEQADKDHKVLVKYEREFVADGKE